MRECKSWNLRLEHMDNSEIFHLRHVFGKLPIQTDIETQNLHLSALFCIIYMYYDIHMMQQSNALRE